MKKTKINNIVLKTIALFLILNNIRFKSFPIPSSWKIAVLLLAIMFLEKYGGKIKMTDSLLFRKASSRLWWFQVILMILLPFYCSYRAGLYNLRSSEFFDITSPIVFVLLGLVVPFMLVTVFDSRIEFLKSLLLVSVLSALFCIMEFRWMRLKVWLDANIVSSNISFLSLDRARGLGGEGASLSVILYFGIFSACWLIVFEKDRLRYWMCIITILIAQIFVGRTGIYLGAVTIAWALILRARYYSGLRRIVCILVIGIIIFAGIMAYGGPIISKIMKSTYYEMFDRNFNMGRHFGEGSFMSIMQSMDYPKLNWEFLFGYGVTRGDIGNGSEFITDSGYAKRILQCGWILAITSYTSLLALFCSLLNKLEVDKNERRMYGLFIFLLFVAELKEPFVFYSFYTCMILTIIGFTGRTNTCKQMEQLTDVSKEQELITLLQ